MIELNNLQIGYSNSILSCENLILETGKMYVLVGKNGSGKSTFLKTLSKQILPKNGHIKLDNRSIQGISIGDLPKLLCYVPVHFPHMDYVRTREYISSGRAPYTNALGKLTPNDSEEIENAIKLLEINQLSDRFTSELSDGEKQLVAISKAIAQKTSIILLDEPTAFLDYSNKQKVLGFLKATAIQLNKCIVLSAHDIDLCMEFTSDFLVVNEANKTLEYQHNPSKETILNAAFPV
jgi:iron complex transport system ATP-binding protein